MANLFQHWINPDLMEVIEKILNIKLQIGSKKAKLICF